MTFDEAMAELGIDDGAGPDEARRAYLRLLKTRKPEVDPTGFMRLREAYELVKPRLSWRAMVLASSAVKDAQPGPPELESAGAPEPLALAAPTDEPLVSLTRAPPEDATAAPPPTDEPPGEALDDQDDPPEDEPRDDERPSDPPLSRARDEDADALLAAGLHEQAAEALAGLFAHAKEGAHDATPAVPKALRLMLALYAKSSPAAAAALGASLFDYVRAAGDEARAIRGPDAARWTLLRELAALPPSFPDVIRAAVARAALAGDLGQARGELAVMAQRGPGPAAVAASQLRRSAPVIAAALADALEPVEAPRASGGRGQGARAPWYLGIFAVGLLRMLANLGSSSSTPSYDTTQYARQQIEARLDGGAARASAASPLGQLREAALHRADRVEAHADYALGSDGGPPRALYETMSLLGRRIEGAVARGDCGAAREHARALSALFGADGGALVDEIGRVEVSTLDRALDAYCKALDPSSPGGATP